MVIQACSFSTREGEIGGLGVQDQAWLHGEFEAKLGYVKVCLKIMVIDDIKIY